MVSYTTSLFSESFHKANKPSTPIISLKAAATATYRRKSLVELLAELPMHHLALLLLSSLALSELLQLLLL